MVRVTAGLIVACWVLSGQNVTVALGDWSAHGIEITPYSSPGFSVKASAVAPASVDFTPLYPFSFVLTNHTGRPIVAYSTLWAVKDAGGIVTPHYGLVGSLRLSMTGRIPDGADRLVTLVSEPSGMAATISREIAHAEGDVLRAEYMFSNASSVDVSLEVVMLDNGLALGPDSNRTIPRLRGEAEGSKKLASDVLTAFNGGGTQAVVDLLSGIVDGAQPSASAASRMSSVDDAYVASAANTRYVRAREWLRLAERNAPLLEKIAYQQVHEPYLPVHYGAN
jgi:hypothetical protein